MKKKKKKSKQYNIYNCISSLSVLSVILVFHSSRMLFICVPIYVLNCGFSPMSSMYIFFRLVEPSEDAHSKDPRSFMQGVVVKAMDIIAKAKVLIIGLKISFWICKICFNDNFLTFHFLADCLCIIARRWGGFNQCVCSSCDAHDVIKDNRL